MTVGDGNIQAGGRRIPAYAGMTVGDGNSQTDGRRIPAYAGMTVARRERR